MKPFDLEKAKAGHPIVTRDGRDIEFIGVSSGSLKYPVCAVFDQSIQTFTRDGLYALNEVSQFDLFMAPTKVKRWVNVYANHRDDRSYASKYIADLHGQSSRIACVEIEFEEP